MCIYNMSTQLVRGVNRACCVLRLLLFFVLPEGIHGNRPSGGSSRGRLLADHWILGKHSEIAAKVPRASREIQTTWP